MVYYITFYILLYMFFYVVIYFHDNLFIIGCENLLKFVSIQIATSPTTTAFTHTLGNTEDAFQLPFTIK